MNKDELKKKIMAVMQHDHCQDAYERMAEALFDSIRSDDEPYRKVGYHLLKAFLEDDVDAASIAICGWPFQSLMVKAGLLPDTEGVFYDAVSSDALTPFEKSILAKTIAHDIVHDGTTNTGSGSWIVYFDEVQDKYKVDLSEDEEMLEAITEELHNSFEKEIAEISVLDDAIDLTFYLDFCPNAEE